MSKIYRRYTSYCFQHWRLLVVIARYDTILKRESTMCGKLALKVAHLKSLRGVYVKWHYWVLHRRFAKQKVLMMLKTRSDYRLRQAWGCLRLNMCICKHFAATTTVVIKNSAASLKDMNTSTDTHGRRSVGHYIKERVKRSSEQSDFKLKCLTISAFRKALLSSYVRRMSLRYIFTARELRRICITASFVSFEFLVNDPN